MSPAGSSTSNPPPQKSRMPIVLVTVLVALLAGAAFIWRQKVSQAQCDALLDHYAELVVKEQYPDAGPQEVAAEKQRERSEATRGEEFKNCTSEVQSSEHDCAMKATSSEAVIKCLE